MIIKVKRNVNDDSKKHDHLHLSRRDFIARGVITGAMTVALPKILMGGLVKDAVAAATCPTPVRTPGGMSHVLFEGGMTAGAYILGDIPSQIAASSATAAARYGINQNMLKLGANFNVNADSIFWKVLQQTGMDLGYSASQWRVALNKVSAGAHYGPFNQDDGGAAGTGLLGRTAAFKQTPVNALEIGVNHKLVGFANGMPVASVRGQPGVADIGKVFSLNPSNLTNAQTMANSAAAAASLSDLFSSMFNTKGRTGGTTAVANATCGFAGDSVLADPAYGSALFNPAAIPALSPLVAGGKLTTGEQAYLAAFYNAAIGLTAGNGIQEGGFDYHGQTPQNIGAATYRVARIVGMWLAASDKAGANATLSIVSNGQAIAKGFTSAMINGVTGNVQNADGDAGGNFNGAALLMFSPNGAAPGLKNTGAFDTTNGDVRSTIGAELAIAGIYASAISFIKGSLSDSDRVRLGLATAADFKNVSLLA